LTQESPFFVNASSLFFPIPNNNCVILEIFYRESSLFKQGFAPARRGSFAETKGPRWGSETPLKQNPSNSHTTLLGKCLLPDWVHDSLLLQDLGGVPKR
ncbi:MAG: hypothetical protein P8X46_13890, partial [Nitrospirales bacterium]